MTSTHVPPITEEDIANFLTNTPGFFERHAEVLASVQITSPHGQRAVSLQERQAEMLREKIKGLEHRIMDMVRNSNDNTAIATKVHQWTSALLRVKDPFDLPEAVVGGIRTLFDVPQAAVRVWTVAGPYIDADFTQGASEDARAFASSLTMPFCGPNLGFEPAGWLAQEAGEPSTSRPNAGVALSMAPSRSGSRASDWAGSPASCASQPAGSKPRLGPQNGMVSDEANARASSLAPCVKSASM